MSTPTTTRIKNSSFKDRGGETTRIETFVDASFAFALTLLVISFDEVPSSYIELTAALRQIPAFLMSFGLIVLLWLAHRNWSKRYGLDTTYSTLLSLALVFIVMVYVFPLRAMSSAAVSAMTGGWVPSDFMMTTVAEVRGLFTIYGLGFFIACVVLILLNLHAYRLRAMLELDARETYLTRAEMYAWSIVGGVALISVLLAQTLPPYYLGAAGWVYMSLSFLMPTFGVLSEKYSPKRSLE